MYRIFLQLLMFIGFSSSLAPNDVVIFILSQPVEYFNQLANKLRSNLYNQSLLISKNELINIHIIHEKFQNRGSWTFLEILPYLSKTNIIKSNIKWIILCEDQSGFNLTILLNELNKIDYTEKIYLGHPLYDLDPTVIHHYKFYEYCSWFPYPHFRAGVAFSVPLIQRLTNIVYKIKRPNFYIDASHELALYIYENILIEKNIKNVNGCVKTNPLIKDKDIRYEDLILINASYFCSEYHIDCAIYPVVPEKCNSVNVETIYFAIKTCQEYHKTRVPIIEKTWGRYVVHKKYFSDVSDNNIPTTSTGIPNNKYGHCLKSFVILSMVVNEIIYINSMKENNHIKWIFFADDDTLLSVSGVCNILGCLNTTDDIYLGRRYGYGLALTNGFNYITGGGGIILSLSTAVKLLKHCSCSKPDAPDDMVIGQCLDVLDIIAIHSSGFHQGRPIDYPYKILVNESPVTFHKFDGINPIDLYRKWFKKADKKMMNKLKINNININNSSKHDNNCPCTNIPKIFKKINRNNLNHSNSELQEHSKYHTTFKSKLQHIDL